MITITGHLSRPAHWTAILLATFAGGSLQAQSAAPGPSAILPLSLEQALERGMNQSEEIRLARSATGEARARIREAKADLYPQISGDVLYTRTLRSPFQVESSSPADTFRFQPDPTAPLEDRVRYLEQNTPNAAFGAINSLFSGFPIGQKNTWVGRINLSQTVFDGTVFAGVSAAREFEALARAQETESEAELRLQIIQAYYDAVLAQQLIVITDSSAGQLDRQLDQIRLVRSAGNASDLDVLRVRVDRQNLEPDLVAAANQRDLSLLNLKRLVNLPVDAPLALTDSLSTAGFVPVSAPRLATLTREALVRRASIEAGNRQVALQRQQLRATKAAALPTVSATAAIGKQSLPSGFLPGDFQDDWTVGFAVKIPIFSGFRRSSQVAQAKEQLRQSELQLDQLREQVAVDVEQQRGELNRAAALIQARAQTTAQASKVYQLADLAYGKGVATRLDLQDARLSLSKARGNEAQAIHDYYLALARLLRAAGSPMPLTVALNSPHAVPPAGDADLAGR